MEDRLKERLGLSVPREWWPSPPLLKSFEAAGFARLQVHPPPAEVLADARRSTPHAAAVAASLAETRLRPVVHAPAGLRAGTRDSDRAFDGLLSYAAQIGASHAVYHACALPDDPASEDALLFEARSLSALASRAERLGVTIAIENLAPVYPGPETLSASPMALRGLAQRIGSERVGLCLDLGHAHIVAELRHTSLEALIEPVLDVTALFHLHDNLGARWHTSSAAPGVEGADRGVDPLRLDLHLPPGRGTLPWERLAPLLRDHEAPLLLEVHPPHLPRAAELHGSVAALLEGRDRAFRRAAWAEPVEA